MLKIKSLTLAALGSVLCFCANAAAVTIDGSEYELFASMSSATSSDQFGHWAYMQKYTTFRREGSGTSPIGVSNVQLADDLAGFTVSQIHAMGTATSRSMDSRVASGSVTLLGAAGEDLFTASYVRAGSIDSTNVLGRAGQLNVDGIYTVTGGQFLTAGFDATQIYLQIAFNNVTENNDRDIWSNDGTFNFYRPATGDTEVPEPATALLVGSSLALLHRRRRAQRSV